MIIIITTHSIPAAEFFRILLPGQVKVQGNGSIKAYPSVVVHDYTRWARAHGLLFGLLLLGKQLFFETNIPPIYVPGREGGDI